MLVGRASDDGSDWRYYAYQPSFVLPIVCLALYALVAIGLLARMFRSKAWYMWPFCVGIAGESLGYVFRRLSASHPTGRGAGLTYYLLSSLFIILAPALMAASIYMLFGRLITYVGERYSPIRARRVTLTFVTFDIVSFVVQGGGGAIYASPDPSKYTAAKAILLAGFLIQIISFGIFAVFAVVYQIRAKKSKEEGGPWSTCLWTMYAGCLLILLRGIFRCIEFGTGQNQEGPLLSHEAFYYGLETLPIFLCSVLFLVSFPSRYIPSDRSIRLHPDLSVPVAPPVLSAVGDTEKQSSQDTLDSKAGGVRHGRRWWRGKNV